MGGITLKFDSPTENVLSRGWKGRCNRRKDEKNHGVNFTMGYLSTIVDLTNDSYPI